MARKNSTSNEKRSMVIDAHVSGMTATQISKIFNMPRTTIIGIVNVFEAESRVEAKKRGGDHRKKVTDEIKARVQEIIDGDCTKTLKSIALIVSEEFGIEFSVASISRFIKGFNYTFKRLSIQPIRRNTEETIQKRKDYADWFQRSQMEQPNSKVYFLDEVGFSVSMRSSYGRSLVGTTPVAVVNSIRTRNISVCAVYSREKLEYYESKTSAFNSASFSDFLDNFLNILDGRNERNAILIMDNVAFHKTILVRQKFAERGFIQGFLPPYSPFLNPIENVFSKVKQYVKMAKPTNEEELMRFIKNGWDGVTTSDCSGYWENMMGYLRRCFDNEEITD